MYLIGTAPNPATSWEGQVLALRTTSFGYQSSGVRLLLRGPFFEDHPRLKAFVRQGYSTARTLRRLWSGRQVAGGREQSRGHPALTSTRLTVVDEGPVVGWRLTLKKQRLAPGACPATRVGADNRAHTHRNAGSCVTQNCGDAATLVHKRPPSRRPAPPSTAEQLDALCYRTLRLWIPFPDRYTDLPISYRYLGVLSFLITLIFGMSSWSTTRVRTLSHRPSQDPTVPIARLCTLPNQRHDLHRD